jgi:glycosyltransferase involved in cell wall biosynthesis
MAEKERIKSAAAQSFRYESIFAHASFQFCGHIDEYLIANTRRLCLLYCQPRFGEHHHTLRLYEEGRLLEERIIPSSQRLLPYYLLWLWHHNVELWRFTRGQKEKTLVFCGHPVAFLGNVFMRLFRKIACAYWIGDYFPGDGLVIRMYERLKRFYHDHVPFAYYLTDAINRQFNGGCVREDERHRTVMWGLSPFKDCTFPRTGSKRMLFVGLVRNGQGVEEMLEFIASHDDYSLALVGVAANGYEKTVQAAIDRLGISSRVYFENRFHAEAELREIAKTCCCGMALYDVSDGNFTHYADPGNVKAYMELGLPVVMTRISDIVPYVERFKAGEVVDSPDDVCPAIERIAADPQTYSRGVAAFNDHFSYASYYAESFKALEGVWR